MEYDETTAEDVLQSPVDSSDDTETVTSPQVIKENNLTNEQIANRIILQLQYNNDCYLEENEKLNVKLDSILSSLSVSENDLPEEEEEEEEKVDVKKVFRSSSPVYTIEDDANARDLLAETVSQNDIVNMDLMTKKLDSFNVTESLLVIVTLLLFAHLIFDLFKKY